MHRWRGVIYHEINEETGTNTTDKRSMRQRDGETQTERRRWARGVRHTERKRAKKGEGLESERKAEYQERKKES